MRLILSLVAMTVCIHCYPRTTFIKTEQQWTNTLSKHNGIQIGSEGLSLIEEKGTYLSKIKRLPQKSTLTKIVVEQHPQWNTWKEIPKTTPKDADDAPVFIPIKQNDYWYLGHKRGDFKNGYHAWHSTNMKAWQYHGPVSTHAHKWVTSAEYHNEKFYIYFDFPNDEDPHLIIDDDLTDGKQGQVVGKVFDDPSHGSDMAIFRDDDDTFHLIYEDWSPINPPQHAWDSPLAGHTSSPDGITGLPHTNTLLLSINELRLQEKLVRTNQIQISWYMVGIRQLTCMI